MHNRPTSRRAADNGSKPTPDHGTVSGPTTPAGDHAFEALVRARYGELWRLVWRIVREDAACEEVLCTVFLAARRAPAERAEDAAWLRRIAVAEAAKQVRPRRARASRPLVEACFESLDGSLRAALALTLEKLRYEQVGDALGVSTQAARSRVALARTSLRSCMRRKGGARG